MQLRILILLVLLCGVACNREQRDDSDLRDRGTKTDIAFDPTKWSHKEGLNYPYRDQMLNDLVYNDSVRTLSKAGILDHTL